MKVKRSIVYLMIISMVFIFMGCKDNNINKETSTAKQKHIKVVDCIGREVEVPQNPDRVACIFAPSAHIVSMLGDSEKIVAVSEGNKRDYLFLDIYPVINNVRTPKGSGNLNIEELFKEPAPQIIFSYTDIIHNKKIMKKLERFGVPIVVIDFRTVKEQQYAVDLIGKIIGKEDKAKEFNHYYNSVVELVTEKASEIHEEEKKTVYHAVNELLRTDINNSLPAEWIPKTGSIPVGVSKGETSSNGANKNFMTLEQFFKYNPEYIIINGKDVFDYIQASDRLHVLSAYKNKKIFLMPLGVTRWGHPYSIESPLAILWTAKTIYPEYFKDIDLLQETKDFYIKFFDYKLSDEEAKKILEGRSFKNIKGNRK